MPFSGQEFEPCWEEHPDIHIIGEARNGLEATAEIMKGYPREEVLLGCQWMPPQGTRGHPTSWSHSAFIEGNGGRRAL